MSKNSMETESLSNTQHHLLRFYRRTPLAPAHSKIRQSPLALTDNDQRTDLRGFINLGVIVIIAMCGQLVLENLRKYGIMLNFVPTKPTTESLRALPLLSTALGITLLT